jgi:hypothetical protein
VHIVGSKKQKARKEHEINEGKKELMSILHFYQLNFQIGQNTPITPYQK